MIDTQNRHRGRGPAAWRNMRHSVRLLLLLLALTIASPTQAAAPEDGDGVPWWTVDNGGGSSSGNGYQLTGTAGQPDAGPVLSSGGYGLHGGFWRAHTAPPAVNDDDDIPASTEDGAPNDGDGNGDGVADSEQSNVTSLPNSTDGSYLTLAAPAGTALQTVQATTPAVAPPDSASLPEGLLGFQASNMAPGATLMITLTLHSGITPTGYWKYGPTLAQPDDHWYNFAWDGVTGAQIRDNVIVLTLVDGGRGDGDLTANGTIADPGAPIVQTAWRLFLPIAARNNDFLYHEDFAQGPGAEWPQQQQVGTAPNGERFLGEFGNERIALTLGGLPAHGTVTVSFDLYTIRSWDGNQEERPAGVAAYAGVLPAAVATISPDRWLFQADGETLLDTTFANIAGFRQGYPDNAPEGSHPAQTGARARNSLGYVFGDSAMDATYRIERTFAHSSASLTLDFQALGLQTLEDESWGIDNITVRTSGGLPAQGVAP